MEAVSVGFLNSCSLSFVFAFRDNTLSPVNSSVKILCVGLGGNATFLDSVNSINKAIQLIRCRNPAGSVLKYQNTLFASFL